MDADLRVRVERDGSIHFRGEKLTGETLEAAARAALADSEDKTFVLEADDKAAHGDIVAVMDALRSAGATGLTIATDTKQ